MGLYNSINTIPHLFIMYLSETLTPYLDKCPNSEPSSYLTSCYRAVSYLVQLLTPHKYTYQDETTLERQEEIPMEEYDPAFATLVASIHSNQNLSSPDADMKEGVILVSGYNFGTGFLENKLRYPGAAGIQISQVCLATSPNETPSTTDLPASENMAFACFVDYSTLMPTYCFLFLLFLII